MEDISLVTGWLPWLVGVLAVAAVLVSISWRNGPWRSEVVWGAVVSVGGVTLLALANRVLQLLPFTFPPSFYVLFGLLVFGKVTDHERTLPELLEITDTARTAGELPRSGYTARVSIPATVSGFDARKAYIYLPPAYFADPTPKLPVLMLLHGVPGGPEDWLVVGQADKVADAFAARHGGKTPILVMPDATGSDFNDTECTDSSRGDVETYLVTDVPNYVNTTLGTEAGATSWGVAGLSMGGYCSCCRSGTRRRSACSVTTRG